MSSGTSSSPSTYSLAVADASSYTGTPGTPRAHSSAASVLPSVALDTPPPTQSAGTTPEGEIEFAITQDPDCASQVGSDLENLESHVHFADATVHVNFLCAQHLIPGKLLPYRKNGGHKCVLRVLSLERSPAPSVPPMRSSLSHRHTRDEHHVSCEYQDANSVEAIRSGGSTCSQSRDNLPINSDHTQLKNDCSFSHVPNSLLTASNSEQDSPDPSTPETLDDPFSALTNECGGRTYFVRPIGPPTTQGIYTKETPAKRISLETIRPSRRTECLLLRPCSTTQTDTPLGRRYNVSHPAPVLGSCDNIMLSPSIAPSLRWHAASHHRGGRGPFKIEGGISWTQNAPASDNSCHDQVTTALSAEPEAKVSAEIAAIDSQPSGGKMTMSNMSDGGITDLQSNPLSGVRGDASEAEIYHIPIWTRDWRKPKLDSRDDNDLGARGPRSILIERARQNDNEAIEYGEVVDEDCGLWGDVDIYRAVKVPHEAGSKGGRRGSI